MRPAAPTTSEVCKRVSSFKIFILTPGYTRAKHHVHSLSTFHTDTRRVCIVALTSRGHGSHDARIMGDPRTCADPKPLSVTGSNRMAGPSNRGPCSASRPGWVHRAPYDDTGGHMLKIHGTAPHSRHTSPSSLRRGRGVLSLRARTVEKAPLPSTKVGSASGAGSTRAIGIKIHNTQ